MLENSLQLPEGTDLRGIIKTRGPKVTRTRKHVIGKQYYDVRRQSSDDLFELDSYTYSLSGMDLSYVDFAERDLTGGVGVPSSTRSDYYSTDCSNTSFLGASFIGTNIRETNFSGADLRYADVHGAKMWRKRFGGTQLADTKLAFVRNAQETSWEEEDADARAKFIQCVEEQTKRESEENIQAAPQPPVSPEFRVNELYHGPSR